MATFTASPDRRPAGPPARTQAQRRDEDVLDAALALFIERGFDRATLEAIVARAGVSKRTLRARYPDKRALFVAAMARAIDRAAVPQTAFWVDASDDLEATLLAVARLLARATGPAERRLLHPIDAEAERFPDLARRAHARGTASAIAFAADLLRRHAERGTIRVARAELAATAFLAMVTCGSGLTWNPIARRTPASMSACSSTVCGGASVSPDRPAATSRCRGSRAA